MRKLICVFMAVMMIMLTGVHACADDTGVMVIGGPESEAETVNLDDIQKDQTVKIAGFGDIKMSWQFVDYIPTGLYESGDVSQSLESGLDAEYLCICINILNTQKTEVDFKSLFGDVVCTFGDGYQFAGWVRQERRVHDTYWTMCESADSHYAIASLYDGYFDVVVTLPNYVVESKEPLSVTFSIGDNEFTCNIRK